MKRWKEMLKEELSEAKSNIAKIEQELKVLLIPKDPMDEKNVIVEIRAGAGGDEAALFAAETFPYVFQVCRIQALEDRDDGCQREWYRRFQGVCFHGQRRSCLFTYEV